MNRPSDFLTELLSPQRLSRVVDVGANPIDGDPPYKQMLQMGLCEVTGFEPQASALQTLNNKKSPLETYLPFALGDGQMAKLHICQYSGWTVIPPISTGPKSRTITQPWPDAALG